MLNIVNAIFAAIFLIVSPINTSSKNANNNSLLHIKTLESIGKSLSFRDKISFKKIIHFHNAYLLEEEHLSATKQNQNFMKISLFRGIDLKRQIESVTSFYNNSKITDSHKSILSDYLLFLGKKTVTDTSGFCCSVMSLAPLFSINKENVEFQSAVCDIAMDNFKKKDMSSSSFSLYHYKINDYVRAVTDEKIIGEINELDQIFKNPQAVICEWQNKIDDLYDKINTINEPQIFENEYKKVLFECTNCFNGLEGEYKKILEDFSAKHPTLYSLIKYDIKNIKKDVDNVKKSLSQELKFMQKKITLGQNDHFLFQEDEKKIIFSKKNGITYCFKKQKDRKYDLYFFEQNDILYIKEDNAVFAVLLKDLRNAAVKNLITDMVDNVPCNVFGDIVLRKIFNYIFFLMPLIALSYSFYKVKNEKDFSKKIEEIKTNHPDPLFYTLPLLPFLSMAWSPSVTAFDFYSILELIFCRK